MCSAVKYKQFFVKKSEKCTGMIWLHQPEKHFNKCRVLIRDREMMVKAEAQISSLRAETWSTQVCVSTFPCGQIVSVEECVLLCLLHRRKRNRKR